MQEFRRCMVTCDSVILMSKQLIYANISDIWMLAIKWYSIWTFSFQSCVSSDCLHSSDQSFQWRAIIIQHESYGAKQLKACLAPAYLFWGLTRWKRLTWVLLSCLWSCQVAWVVRQSGCKQAKSLAGFSEPLHLGVNQKWMHLISVKVEPGNLSVNCVDVYKGKKLD